jgi:hypothetical protein
LWKAFIDFEIEQEEYDRVRQLYKSLLRHTNHIKVVILLCRKYGKLISAFLGLG